MSGHSVFFEGMHVQACDAVGDFLRNEARGDRRSVVMNDRHQARRTYPGLVDQQGGQLSVQVLLEDEDLAVRRDEVDDLDAAACI